MLIKKFFFTLLIASMILSKTQALADFEPCEVYDYEGCGYSECRRSACLLIAFAWGMIVFAGMYAIILEDSEVTHSH